MSERSIETDALVVGGGGAGFRAAGECTLGPFGANRVCSAITEMLVQGADAGQNAGEYARKIKVPDQPLQAFHPLQEKAERALMRKSGPRPAKVRRRVQKRAHQNLSPIRNQEELSAFLSFHQPDSFFSSRPFVFL